MTYSCDSDTLLAESQPIAGAAATALHPPWDYPYRDGAVVMAIINNQREINAANKAGFPVYFAPS